MKKRFLTITLIISMAACTLAFAGCKNKDKDATAGTEAADNTEAADSTDNAADDTPPAADTATSDDSEQNKPLTVTNNGGYFVKVGDKVYFTKPAEDNVEVTALSGYFINPYKVGTGNKLMCYDEKSGGKAEEFADAMGCGPLVYYDGCLYGSGADKEDSYIVYEVNLETKKTRRLTYGILESFDSETGRIAVRKEDNEQIYFEIYDGAKLISATDKRGISYNGTAYISGDYIVYEELGLTEDYTDCCVVVSDYVSGEEFNLGSIPEPEFEDDTAFRVIENVELIGSKMYFYISWYAGTGFYLQDSYVYFADLNEKDTAVFVKDKQKSEEYYAQREKEESDTTYYDIFNPTPDDVHSCVPEVAEDVDGTVYAVVNDVHNNRAETIGWRIAMTVDAVRYYKINGDKPEEIADALEFPENANVGNEEFYYIENPDGEYYMSDLMLGSKPGKARTLNQTVKKENNIIDTEAWFEEYDLWGLDCDTGELLPSVRDEYNSETNTGYFLDFYEEDTNVLKYTLDLSEFYDPRFVTNNHPGLSMGWYAEYRYAYVENNIAYISMYHMTYADTMPFHAYIIAVDLNTGALLWRSLPLVCNSNNFVVLDDVIISGYGFTAEPDYIYQIDKSFGTVLNQTPVKSQADYLIMKDGKLYVRTYNTDYVFEVK